MKLFSSGRKTPTSSPASSHAGAMDETVGVTSTSEAANVATQPVPTPSKTSLMVCAPLPDGVGG